MREYVNPIIYADYSDPDAIRVGDDYYMVASSFCNAPGLPVLHSKDLVHWEIVNYVLDRIPDAKYDTPVHGCGVWAPSIRYHAGVYYACFPMPDEGIFMCTAKDPCGKWSAPKMLLEGPGWIDPCPLWDEDGRAYLVYGVAKSRIGYKSVLYVREMAPDGMSLIGKAVKVFDGNENDQTTIEGPKFYRRNGWYYIFAPAGGVKSGWQTVLRSRNVFGPYEYRVVMRQGDSPVNGPHQGAWVDTVTGEDWFLHFQDVYAAGRIVHLQPMRWVDDWPVIGVSREGAEYGEPVLRYEMPDVGECDCASDDAQNVAACGGVAVGVQEPRAYEIPASDDFDGERLGLQWQWNANPREAWYTLSEHRLVLRAVCFGELRGENGKGDIDGNAAGENAACDNAAGAGAAVPYGDLPNLLLQKWPAPEFVCDAQLDLSGLTPGDEAGMISFGMQYGLVTFRRKADGFHVTRVSGKQVFGKIYVDHTEEEEEEICILPADTREVRLRCQVERVGLQDIGESGILFPKERVSMCFGTGHISDTPVMEMTAVPGRWVGVKFGFFCTSERDGSEGYAAVSRVRVERS
ncbi:MAG: glycoside hydrolase 43 family protein [Lachnospiraceae bacterium]|nr:glycoside hydrolase 43 family protein [Lachnospiraceae bacterium]